MTGSQKALTEPCRWQSHAGETRNRGTTLRNPLHASSPLMQAPAACPRLPGWTSRGKHCLRSRANPSRICRIIRRSTLQARLTYVCIHWGQSRRFQGHIGRRFFQPRSAGTGTGLRWGHRRSLASPEGRTHTLQGKKRSRPGTQQRLRPERRAACHPRPWPGLSPPWGSLWSALPPRRPGLIRNSHGNQSHPCEGQEGSHRTQSWQTQAGFLGKPLRFSLLRS